MSRKANPRAFISKLRGRKKRRGKRFEPLLSRAQEIFLFCAVTGLGTLVLGMMAFGWTSPNSSPPLGNVGSPGVPAGTIAFFAGACPSGWTEYTALRGRALVGTPSGGTDTGTVGSALANLASRTISQVVAHTHSIDPPSTASGANSVGHTHSVDPPDTTVSISDPGHSHEILGKDAAFSSGDPNTVALNSESNDASAGTDDVVARTTGITASVDIGSFTSGGESAGHTHNLDISAFNSASTGSASVDVTMPYIQLRACQKS